MLRSLVHERSEAAGDAWQGVEQLLDDAAQIGSAARSASEFQAALLSRAVAAIAGCGGAIWMRDRTGRLALAAAQGQAIELLAEAPDVDRHGRELAGELAARNGGPVHFRWQSSPDAGEPLAAVAANYGGADEEGSGVLEVLVADDTGPHVREGQGQVLSAFAEIATEFHRKMRLGELSAIVRQWEHSNESALRVHVPLDLRSTCYALANELRSIADCDRVTVLVRRGSRLRVVAISGVATFDTRSPVVREIERLAAAVAQDEQPFWYAEGEPLDETSSWQLGGYLDHSPARALGAVTLRQVMTKPESTSGCDHRALGMVVCERFDQRPFLSGERELIGRFCRQAAVAIDRTTELERWPLIRLSRGLGRLGVTTRPATRAGAIVAILLAAAVLVIGGMWPVAFAIRATGTMQPADRRDMFAPVDGVVREVRVREGDRVASGDIVLILRSDELELEITRVHGELQTARRQLQAVQATRRDASKPAGTDARFAGTQLAAEEERLKEVVQSLESQHHHRLQQREQLTIRSPVAGTVLTWDVERLLGARPVQRGQRLLSIADVEGAWQLELRAPDADAGHVLRTRRDSTTELPVSYRIISDPARRHQAVLDRVSDWIETRDEQGPAVWLTARIPEPDRGAVRPGAAVAAEIQLGDRPRVYVWFRDVWEFVRIRLWF